MKAILIFDNVNDLLFHKWNSTFIQCLKNCNEQEDDINVVDTYTVSQLLCPIVTSQRVMSAQFSNTYSSMKCKNGTNIVFDEWLDHVLMVISEDDVDDLHRELMDCKTFIQHICGQNICLLQSPIYHDWLSMLLENHNKGDSIPGASGGIGESGATATALSCLKTATKDIKCSYQHYHLMLFVGDKILALYSSRGTEDLTPPDLILLSKQCITAQEYWAGGHLTDEEKNINNPNAHLPWLSQENSAIVNLCAGTSGCPCAPHSLHLTEVAPRITLAIVVDLELREVGVAAQLTSQILSNVRKLLLQRNLELLPGTLDALEAATKKTTDALRKSKLNLNLCTRLTSRMSELRKSCATTTPLTPETTASAMHTALEAVLEQLRPDIPSIINMDDILRQLQEKMAPLVDFIHVKAMSYFSLGSDSEEETSCSSTRHKYVDEFPGLIHFIFVDRTNGRYLAPDMADCADILTADTVRKMMSRSLRVVREGYCAATWRAGALHACAVTWWERAGGAGGAGGGGAAPRALHPAAVRALPPPGDVLGSFYKQLSELAFPNESDAVCLKELVCIHLGLLPVGAAVQQARRLALAVRDAAGSRARAAAADLL